MLVTDSLKEHNAFVFRVRLSRKSESTVFLQNIASCNITDDLNIY